MYVAWSYERFRRALPQTGIDSRSPVHLFSENVATIMALYTGTCRRI